MYGRAAHAIIFWKKKIRKKQIVKMKEQTKKALQALQYLCKSTSSGINTDQITSSIESNISSSSSNSSVPSSSSLFSSTAQLSIYIKKWTLWKTIIMKYSDTVHEHVLEIIDLLIDELAKDGPYIQYPLLLLYNPSSSLSSTNDNITLENSLTKLNDIQNTSNIPHYPYNILIPAIQSIAYQGYETLSSTGTLQTSCLRPSLAQFQLYLSDTSLHYYQYIACLEGINYSLWLGPYSSPRPLRPSAYNEAFRTLSSSLITRQLPETLIKNKKITKDSQIPSSSLPFYQSMILLQQSLISFHSTFNDLRLNPIIQHHLQNTLLTTTTLSTSSISLLTILPNQIINIGLLLRYNLLYRVYPIDLWLPKANVSDDTKPLSFTSEELLYYYYQSDIQSLLQKLLTIPFIISSNNSIINLPKLLEYFWAGANGLINGHEDTTTYTSTSTNSLEEHLITLAYPLLTKPKQKSKKTIAKNTDTSTTTKDNTIAEPTLPAPLANVIAGANDRLESESDSSDDEDDEEERQEIIRESQEYRTIVASLLLYTLDEGNEYNMQQLINIQNLSIPSSSSLYNPTSTSASLPSSSSTVSSYSLDIMHQSYVPLFDRYSIEIAKLTSLSARPATNLFPSIYHPTYLLRYALAPIEILLTEAAAAIQNVAQYSVQSSDISKNDTKDIDDSTPISLTTLLHSSSITSLHIVYGLGITSLRILYQLLHSIISPPVGTSTSFHGSNGMIVPFLDMVKMNINETNIVSSDSETNDTSNNKSVPFELRLFQSLIMFIIHCPIATYRSLSLTILLSLVNCYIPSTRLYIISSIIENCPYPIIVGLLIDEVRKYTVVTYRTTTTTTTVGP